MSRRPRQCRIRTDPHLFEASPDMLASDDDIAMGRPDAEMDDDGWWSEYTTEARLSARREVKSRGARKSLETGLA